MEMRGRKRKIGIVGLEEEDEGGGCNKGVNLSPSQPHASYTRNICEAMAACPSCWALIPLFPIRFAQGSRGRQVNYRLETHDHLF